jgi:hypothetical protein
MDDFYIEREPAAFVLVNGERVNVKDVETLDISEDFHGRDVLTFMYNGKRYESYIILV